MKKHSYILLVLLVLISGFFIVKNNILINSREIYKNSKYHFVFNIGSSVSLKGDDAWICGGTSKICGYFDGSPGFHYWVENEDDNRLSFGGEEKIKIGYINRTVVGGTGKNLTENPEDLYYIYTIKDGKIYKTYFGSSIHEELNRYTTEELLSNKDYQKVGKDFEAQPVFTNNNGISFYYAEEDNTPAYCTVNIKGKIISVCFQTYMPPTMHDEKVIEGAMPEQLKQVLQSFTFY